jgi:hypothetical protein
LKASVYTKTNNLLIWAGKIVRGKRGMRGKSLRRGVAGFDCGPKGWKDAPCRRLSAGDGAERGELLEGGIDPLAVEMALKRVLL